MNCFPVLQKLHQRVWSHLKFLINNQNIPGLIVWFLINEIITSRSVNLFPIISIFISCEYKFKEEKINIKNILK